MTAAELRSIILSAEFQTDLEEVSSYLASITQEAPIVHLVAKCLWKQKQLYALERYKKHDLTVWMPEVLYPRPMSSTRVAAGEPGDSADRSRSGAHEH